MTTTVTRHTARVPGSSAPEQCTICRRLSYDIQDELCTDCTVAAIRDAVERAEDALAEAVALADLTDQVPTDLEERIAALRGVK